MNTTIQTSISYGYFDNLLDLLRDQSFKVNDGKIPYKLSDLFQQQLLGIFNEKFKPHLPPDKYVNLLYLVTCYNKGRKASGQDDPAQAEVLFGEAEAASRSLDMESLAVLHAYSLPILAMAASYQGKTEAAAALLSDALLADEFIEKDIERPDWHIHKVYTAFMHARLEASAGNSRAGFSKVAGLINYLSGYSLPDFPGGWSWNLVNGLPAEQRAVAALQMLFEIIPGFVNGLQAAESVPETEILFNQVFGSLQPLSFNLDEQASPPLVEAVREMNNWLRLIRQVVEAGGAPDILSLQTVLAAPPILDYFKLCLLKKIVDVAYDYQYHQAVELSDAAIAFLRQFVVLKRIDLPHFFSWKE